MGRKYAVGRKAWFICQRCGQRGLYRESVFDGHIANLRVHTECYEPQHPQERLVRVSDPVALWRPSPEWGGEPPVLEGEVLDGDDVIPQLSITAEDGSNIDLEWTEAEFATGDPITSHELYRVDALTYTEGGSANFGAAELTLADMELYDTLGGATFTYQDSDFPISPSSVQYAYIVVAISDSGSLESNVVMSSTPS